MGRTGQEGGEEGKEGAGVGRGEKNVKLWKGGKKENFARAAPRRVGGDKGRDGRDLSPCPPLIFENIGDDSYGLK